MSDSLTCSLPHGTKRKAVEAFNVDPDVGSGESVYCNECSDPRFAELVRSDHPSEIIRELDPLWRNQACVCCHLIRKALLHAYKPEWLSHSQNRIGVRCRISLAARHPEDQLQRLDLSKSYDIARVTLFRGEDPIGGALSREGKQELPLSKGARLETTSSMNLRLGETKAKYVMKRRPIRPLPDVSMIKQWISECHLNHPKCRSSRLEDLIKLAGQGRFRLIDVAKKKIVRKSTVERYCALSYVWGTSLANCSKVHWNVTDGKDRPPTDHLNCQCCQVPKTIEDAISFVRDIGEKFLWVDYYCIDQSDPVDKREVIAVMSSIYNCAYLTLIAADGVDANLGLRRLKPNQEAEKPVMLPSGFSEESIGLLLTQPSLESILSRSVWNDRAWTYQEYLLSYRCLFFTRDEVIFDCSHRIFREAYKLSINPAYYPHPLRGIRHHRTHSGKFKSLHTKALARKCSTLREYEDFLTAYLRRHLTYTGDRLDAFSALLRTFEAPHTSADQRYAESGIPLALMYCGLLWEAVISIGDEQVRPIRTDSSGVRIFPTWSWIGWSGYVKMLSKAEAWSWSLQPPLKFVAMDKYNIIAQPVSNQWRLQWPAEGIRLCKPKLDGPVMIHIMAKVIPVRLEVLTAGPCARDTSIEVSIHESGSELKQEPIRMLPEYIWDKERNYGFVLLLWGIDKDDNYPRCQDKPALLLRETAGNTYERISLQSIRIHWRAYHGLVRDCETRYIKLQ